MTLERVQLNAQVINSRGSRSGDNTMRATVFRPGRLCILAVAIVAGLLLCACSSTTTVSPAAGTTSPAAGTTSPAPDTTSPAPGATATAASPTGSPTSAVCQAAAELRTSVNALARVKIGTGTVDQIKSDLADVEAKFTALTAELHNANKTQTSAVKTSLDTLMTAVSNLSANPSASNLRTVATAVGAVTTSAGTLLASLAPQCSGSATASPTS
jgi:hypothetical protein